MKWITSPVLHMVQSQIEYTSSVPTHGTIQERWLNRISRFDTALNLLTDSDTWNEMERRALGSLPTLVRSIKKKGKNSSEKEEGAGKEGNRWGLK